MAGEDKVGEAGGAADHPHHAIGRCPLLQIRRPFEGLQPRADPHVAEHGLDRLADLPVLGVAAVWSPEVQVETTREAGLGQELARLDRAVLVARLLREEFPTYAGSHRGAMLAGEPSQKSIDERPTVDRMRHG